MQRHPPTMARSRFAAAATFALVVTLARALPILAASASLAVSPQSGLASGAFSATYSFSASRCNNQVLQVRWSSPTGKLLQQVAFPSRCGALTVNGLYPPSGTTPAQYSVWATLFQNGSPVAGTQASAPYTISAPPPSPSPTPSSSSAPPPPTKAPISTTSGGSNPPSAPRSAATSSGAAGAATSSSASTKGGLAIAQPGAAGCLAAGCNASAPGADGSIPPLLLATGRWVLNSPIPAVGVVAVMLVTAIWWVYGTPLPAQLASRRKSPIAETAAPEITHVAPDPPAERQIYRAMPSTLYTSAVPPAGPVSPAWTVPAKSSTATAATLPPPPISAPESTHVTGVELGEDGLPRMAPPPPS